MAKKRRNLDYDLLGIATAINKDEYRVPTYQRAYAWGDTAVQDFWDDLKNALDSPDVDYFLGTLVLTPEGGGSRRVTIIDGQQRLATTTLLLAALRDLWLENGNEDQAHDIKERYLSAFDRRAGGRAPRLILNEDDDPYFRALVVGEDDHSTPSTVATKDSHERLESAYRSLLHHLREDVNGHGSHAEERMVNWAEFMDDRATVITVTVPTEADAFVIFETLNDRGASLTIGDLLKNYLFMLAGERLETVKTKWIQALNELELSAENEEFVTFLRHHWSSRFGAVRERDLYRAIKDEIKTPAQAVAHAQYLAEAADHYAAIQSSTDAYWTGPGFSTTTRDNVATLKRLDLEQNRPLLLAVMAHFSKAELKKTLRALVSWSVRGLIVGGIGGGRTEKAYCDAAVKVRAGKVKSAAELLAELAKIVPEDQEFTDAFETASLPRPSLARYLQLTLESTQRGEQDPELVPNANEEQVNLEHILPRRAKSEDWPSFDPDEVARWSNRIGNHCLLKKTHNNKIGNKPWSTKKEILSGSAFTLTSSAASAPDWTRQEIVRRQAELAKLAVKAWPRSPAP